MPFEDSSGLPDAWNRGPLRPQTSRLIFRDGARYFSQGAEMNEMDFIIARRNRRVSDRSIKDGDRVEGAEAIVDIDARTVHCFPGSIYVEGDIHPVPDRVLTNVPMTGEVKIGVRITRTLTTSTQDQTLLGMAPGTLGEGEEGAAREQISLTWGFVGDGIVGEIYQVYLLLHGTIITQLAPPALSGVIEQIARYDYDALGHYAVGDGCMVSALGMVAGNSVFTISEGVANIRGFKRERQAAFTVRREEDPDLETITGESHPFPGTTGGVGTITVNRGPIDNLNLVVITRRKTEQVLRGLTPGGLDFLQESGAIEIESITQGGVPFADSAYLLASNGVNWGPAGDEPAANTTYDVTYLYNTSGLETATHTDTTVTVTGAVNGRPVILGYTSKMPRIDLLCLDVSGAPVYVKGISARKGALPPLTPTNLLKLAEIRNVWFGVPQVDNNGPRNITFEMQHRLFRRLRTMLDQFDRSKAQYEPRVGTPSSKDGIFTDTFVDDFFRDPNEPQTAAVNRGVLQLPINNVLMQVVLGNPRMFTYTTEVIVSQPKRTSTMLINPYDNFTPMPAGMKIEPAADFWTEQVVQFTSPVTREFTAAPDRPPGEEEITEVTEIRQEEAKFLRQRSVAVSLSGFGVGEILELLEFDGVDVKPGGTQQGDANGNINLTFTIPANVPVGRRLLRAEGASDSFAEAIYVGAGQIDVNTMRRVTLITHAAPVPIQITQNFTTIEQTIINNTTNIINQLSNNVVNSGRDSSDRSDAARGGSIDPLAQSFRVPIDRMVTGVNFWIDVVGNPLNAIRVQLATMLNGFPTTDILAEAFVPMTTVTPGSKINAVFGAPVHLSPLQEYCFVILTSDGDHAVSISRLGDIDLPTQERVSSQPYTIGEMFSSSNRRTWTPHPDSDIAFEIVAARFTQTSAVIPLWTGALTSISDIMVRGTVDIPTADADFRFEVVRAGGQVIQLVPGQNFEFSEFVTETVTVRAVMTGNVFISPILYPGTLIAGGRIATSANYVSKAFTMGNAVEISALLATNRMAGGTVILSVDAVDDNWQVLAENGVLALGEGWTEPKYTRDPFTAIQGRIRVQMTGDPANRTSISALRAYSI